MKNNSEQLKQEVAAQNSPASTEQAKPTEQFSKPASTTRPLPPTSKSSASLKAQSPQSVRQIKEALAKQPGAPRAKPSGKNALYRRATVSSSDDMEKLKKFDSQSAVNVMTAKAVPTVVSNTNEPERPFTLQQKKAAAAHTNILKPGANLKAAAKQPAATPDGRPMQSIDQSSLSTGSMTSSNGQPAVKDEPKPKPTMVSPANNPPPLPPRPISKGRPNSTRRSVHIGDVLKEEFTAKNPAVHQRSVSQPALSPAKPVALSTGAETAVSKQAPLLKPDANPASAPVDNTAAAPIAFSSERPKSDGSQVTTTSIDSSAPVPATPPNSPREDDSVLRRAQAKAAAQPAPKPETGVLGFFSSLFGKPEEKPKALKTELPEVLGEREKERKSLDEKYARAEEQFKGKPTRPQTLSPEIEETRSKVLNKPDNSKEKSRDSGSIEPSMLADEKPAEEKLAKRQTPPAEKPLEEQAANVEPQPPRPLPQPAISVPKLQLTTPAEKEKEEERITFLQYSRKAERLSKLYADISFLSAEIASGKFQQSKTFLAYALNKLTKQESTDFDNHGKQILRQLVVMLNKDYINPSTSHRLEEEALLKPAVALYMDFKNLSEKRLDAIVATLKLCATKENDALMLAALCGYYADDKNNRDGLLQQAKEGDAELFHSFLLTGVHDSILDSETSEIFSELIRASSYSSLRPE